VKTLLVVWTLFLIFPKLLSEGYKPPSGFVPNSSTAVKIAEAVLIPVYGEQQITSERPFGANLKDDVWVVEGTLHCPGAQTVSAVSCDGGVATVRISKLDGRILFMWHGK
jgi:NTF2 fold immunity protein